MPLILPPELKHKTAVVERAALPALAFWVDGEARTDRRSRLGGHPMLPADFDWPRSNSGPIDFLLQVDLAELAGFAAAGLLPREGVLSFFYDVEKQPWGFDPKELDGFRVVYTASSKLVSTPAPRELDVPIAELGLAFSDAMTLPGQFSRPYDKLKESGELDEDEFDALIECTDALERSFYPAGKPLHRLLGHSANVQGDMQREAQLVTNGVYCGGGDEDPREKELLAGADDWRLLLQLDSDDEVGIMWGDLGRLFFWIRQQDLQAHAFDRVWMGLQCG